MTPEYPADQMSPTPSPARIAVLDADSGFVQVLTKRLETAGWQYRVLASPVQTTTPSCGSRAQSFSR